jgi:hypothetical protein
MKKAAAVNAAASRRIAPTDDVAGQLVLIATTIG